MFKHFFKNKLMKKEKEELGTQNILLHKSMDRNIQTFRGIFSNDETLIESKFQNQRDQNIKCCILFINGMVSNEMINDNIIQPIINNTSLNNDSKRLEKLHNQVIASNNIEKTSLIEELVEGIICGNTVLLVEGISEALIIATEGWQTRGVEEPSSENVVRGPREGFTESIMTNLSLIRRRLKTKDLKFRFKTLGTRSKTKTCVCYIEGIANEKIVNELMKRLDDIDIDGVMDSGYIQELIKDAPFSPFKTIGNTERPDVVAAKLLEGRVAVILDNTPFVLTLPFVFIEYFQTNEDYYTNYYFSSINRLIRVIGFIMTISISAVYMSLITFHHEIIPTPLLLSISIARKGVPFPTIVEAILLLFAFELLRESGTRIPFAIGQTVSILGALVLGQAAVEARIISAPMLIMVALTGITSLLNPKLQGPTIIIRTIFLLLASFLGLYGYIFGIIGLLIHLLGIRSFGVPYMLTFGSLNPEGIKDTAIRVPWWYMYYRPKLIGSNNFKREKFIQKDGGRKE